MIHEAGPDKVPTFRSSPFLAAVLIAALGFAAPSAFAGGGLVTRTALLVGFPGSEEGAARGALVVPGTVIPLDPAVRSTVAELRAEGARGHRLANVAASLRSTLNLSRVEVSYTLEPELAVGERKDLPPPSVASALRISVELLGMSLETATYRVSFSEGSSAITDSRVAVRRGERAVVGGLDGPDAPYLFLVLEPQEATALLEGVRPPRVGDDMTPPVRLSGPAPSYTQEAREARLQGVVIVQAVIDTARRRDRGDAAEGAADGAHRGGGGGDPPVALRPGARRRRRAGDGVLQPGRQLPATTASRSRKRRSRKSESL